MIRLHVPAIPYTITNDEYSHDAFTGKLIRFGPMMRSRGYEVYHYGVEESVDNFTKNIQLFTKKEWTKYRIKSFMFLYKITKEEAIIKNNDPTYLVNGLSNSQTPLCIEFNKRLREQLIKNYRSTTTDIVCCPLGRTHHDALNGLNFVCVETGVGYHGSYLNYRIFESQSILSITCEKSHPNNYYFVIPMYYNISDFSLSLKPYRIGYFGRLEQVKGLFIVAEIAKRFPHMEFVICGQGDPSPFLKSSNMLYKAPIHGAERSEFLGSCYAILCPTQYIEPFGSVAVEAQLCGTPVISCDHGGFVETVKQFKTGLRCHTLADYCYGVQMAINGNFDRKYIRNRATKYDMYKLAFDFDYTFRSILDIHKPEINGWYAKKSHFELLPSRVYLIIPYFGSFPNYFQLYLDSLALNPLLTVILITDIELNYKIPKNIIHVPMTFEEVNKRVCDFFKTEYNKEFDGIKTHYKLVDFKIIYPLLFREFIPAKPHDYVGWGDCDVIYGKLSNFINEKYDIIGGFHGHFTAIKNNEEFKYLFKKIPNYFDLCSDSKVHGTDEIAYREPLNKYIKENNLKMCFLNASMCDIVPPCYFHLFRKTLQEKNFFNTVHPEKNIKYVFYDKKLITFYDDGTQEESSYCHLQKRKMDIHTTTESYYIYENSFNN